MWLSTTGQAVCHNGGLAERKQMPAGEFLDIESEPLAGVRGIGGGPRQLTFQGPQLTIEVELDGPGRELTCQVVPPQPATLEVRHGGGSLDAGADEFGTFYVPGLPGGAVSLRCVPLSGASRPIATSWVTVADRPLA